MSKRPLQRKPGQYRSREPVREPYDVVLIVCEGQKTEPLYLKRLCFIHKLSSANIEVVSAPGTDPMNIVTFAEERLSGYDRAYCVFDRDGHANFDAALGRISALAASGRNIFGIVSWPCFEFWLLLHFVYSSKSYTRSDRLSSCEAVIKDLKQHLPEYEKGRQSVYDELRPKQMTAIANAMRLAAENLQTGSVNPSTRMHELVDYLMNLRKSGALMNDVIELRDAIASLHNCSATLAQTVPVRETFRGQVVWDGLVYVFDIDGHPEATRAYAWSSPIEGSEKRQIAAVLQLGAIKTPLDAVRAAIVAERRQEKLRE
jgi:hypothetical protein